MILDGLSDIEILGLTVIGEGRGEPIQGQVGIACSCRNRLGHDITRYQNYRGVCLEPKQFSCWNQNDPNYAYLMDLAERLITGQQLTDPYLRQCMLVAKGVANWDIIDNTKGSRYYMTKQLFDTNRPSWAKNVSTTIQHGNQLFFDI